MWCLLVNPQGAGAKNTKTNNLVPLRGWSDTAPANGMAPTPFRVPQGGLFEDLEPGTRIRTLELCRKIETSISESRSTQRNPQSAATEEGHTWLRSRRFSLSSRSASARASRYPRWASAARSCSRSTSSSFCRSALVAAGDDRRRNEYNGLAVQAERTTDIINNKS